eukprot:151767_1
MPNNIALNILYDKRTQLIRANPNDLDWICRQVMKGRKFIPPTCLLLSNLMKKNAKQDLTKDGVWENFSSQYEKFAAEQISLIEDDFMVTMLMTIPVLSGKTSLLRLALEQHNALFLNTERINGMTMHTWFTANSLNPFAGTLFHQRNAQTTFRDAFNTLKNKPIYFYLTPFGYQWTTSLLFLTYVICIILWIATNSSAVHTTTNVMNSSFMSLFESVIWFMNFAFVFDEFIQFYNLRSAYFSVDGAINIWDIIISIIWCVLAGIRFAFIFGYKDVTKSYIPPASSFQTRRLIENINSGTTNSDVFCPPNFFSCRIQYNSSCMVDISSKDNQIIQWMCDYNDNFNNFSIPQRRLQDFVDVKIDSNGNKCREKQITIPSNSTNYLWNSTCSNYYDFQIHNSSNMTTPACIVNEMECVSSFVSQLLVIYNVLWACQVAMLTTRSLSYFESAGGSFAILLRIVRSMMIELLKFGVIIIIVSIGFLFAIWYLFSADVDTGANNTFEDLYDAVIFFFKLLFGGGNVGTIDTFYQNYRVFAQIFIMVFAIIGVRMFMSLLVALMTGAMGAVQKKAKIETSFTTTLYAYKLSKSARFSPMPLNLVVFIESLVIHILNFIPALISPRYLNVYVYINQKRLHAFDNTNKEHLPLNQMDTRRRVFCYYVTTAIPCLAKYFQYNWKLYHIGCYNPIAGIFDGIQMDNTVTASEYFNALEELKGFKLNVSDKLFVKKLTMNTSFCKYCFRPIGRNTLRSSLLTPFQALTNLISCYQFIFLLPILMPIFWILSVWEGFMEYWNEQVRGSQSVLWNNQTSYASEYFLGSESKLLSIRKKTKDDCVRFGNNGVSDVDINYGDVVA